MAGSRTEPSIPHVEGPEMGWDKEKDGVEFVGVREGGEAREKVGPSSMDSEDRHL